MTPKLTPTVKELRRTDRRYRRAVGRVELLQRERDEAIRQAIREGMSHAQIQRALDGPITRARIGQIALRSR